MQTRYKIQQSQDGITWLSVEPLVEDMKESIDILMKIPTEGLPQDYLNHINFKILGLRSVLEFLGAVLTQRDFENAAKRMDTTATHTGVVH